MYSIKDLEKLLGTEAKAIAKVEKIKSDIKTLESAKARMGIMVCRHNTIPALRILGKISHVVDVDVEGSLRMIHNIDCELSVPRYEPKTAKAWLNEETVFNNAYVDYEVEDKPEKLLLSEYELRDIVLEARKYALEAEERVLTAYENLRS